LLKLTEECYEKTSTVVERSILGIVVAMAGVETEVF